AGIARTSPSTGTKARQARNAAKLAGVLHAITAPPAGSSPKNNVPKRERFPVLVDSDEDLQGVHMLTDKRIAIIGSGTMGRSIASGLLGSGKVKAGQLRGTARTKASAEKLAKELGIACTTDNVTAIEGAGIVLLCVKPKDVAKALEGLKESFDVDR